jgi:glycosyltransferase involved in cell wall biosynthesis
MRILIVSSGLKPDHFGGLPSHVEDLLESLVSLGVEVGYLNSGAKSKWPITRFWPRDDLPCPAWNLSSKLSYAQYWTGTKDPLAQIAPESGYRRAFLSVIEDFRPDLVHFHELTSFPIGLFEELRRLSIKIVFSTADFYALCPTVKLFRPDHSFCARKAVDLDCQTCSLSASSERSLQLAYANDQWLGRFIRLRNLVRRAVRFSHRFLARPAEPEAYIERRREFERLLGEVDMVLATSQEQKRIFEDRTRGWNIRFLQRSRKTIRPDRPDPRTVRRNPDRLVFVALNIVNPAKGLSLLEDAFRAIHKDYPEVELHLYGLAEGNAPGIRYFAPYDDSQLDKIIGSADFGILPSIWPEAFGYVGPEMLSRGLPVLASNRGAMPDYVIDGVNGLLFDPSAPKALEGCIRKILDDAEFCRRLWRGVASGDRRYLSIEEHTEKLLEIYHELISKTPAKATC